MEELNLLNLKKVDLIKLNKLGEPKSLLLMIESFPTQLKTFTIKRTTIYDYINSYHKYVI